MLVDNNEGLVTLGPEFSSLLMFIVGYPKIGPNKKNHYCTNSKEVLKKYISFLTLSEKKEISQYPTTQNLSRTVINSSQILEVSSEIKEEGSCKNGK